MERFNSVPIGTIMEFTGEIVPLGWLLCDGSTITSDEYPDLVNILGTTLPSYANENKIIRATEIDETMPVSVQIAKELNTKINRVRRENGSGDVFVNNLFPKSPGESEIGSPTNRFKSIYVDEVYMSTNTLYIGDTPILGTDQDTINIKADPDQSIAMKTSATGTTNIISERGVELSTSGMSSTVTVQATGANSQVNVGATSAVNLFAPNIQVTGNTNFTGNTSTENLTVKGNLNVIGDTTTVNTTQLQVKDNIIEINKGEMGNGVTAGSAGLRVDRGDAPPYNVTFDEIDDLFKIGMDNNLETIATRPYVDNAIAKVNFELTSANDGIIVNGDNVELNTVDDLITGGVKRPLSAEQGKILKQLIDAIGTGGAVRLMKHAEALSENDYMDILPANGTSIMVGKQLFNPTLYLDGARIEANRFSVELNTGLITLVEPYADYDVIWVVEDQMPNHISFCFPTMSLLLASEDVKSRIQLGDVVKILGESDADDGGHYLVKCENVAKLNAVDIGGGRFLNEIPNTKIATLKADILSRQIIHIPSRLGTNSGMTAGWFEIDCEGMVRDSVTIEVKQTGGTQQPVTAKIVVEQWWNNSVLGCLIRSWDTPELYGMGVKISKNTSNENILVYLPIETSIAAYPTYLKSQKKLNITRVEVDPPEDAIWTRSKYYENIIGTISKTANGWCKLANGLIIQWGEVIIPCTDRAHIITYPITFANFARGACIRNYNNTAPKDMMFTGEFRKNNLEIFQQFITPENSSTHNSFQWIALGF